MIKEYLFNIMNNIFSPDAILNHKGILKCFYFLINLKHILKNEHYLRNTWKKSSCSIILISTKNYSRQHNEVRSSYLRICVRANNYKILNRSRSSESCYNSIFRSKSNCCGSLVFRSFYRSNCWRCGLLGDYLDCHILFVQMAGILLR